MPIDLSHPPATIRRLFAAMKPRAVVDQTGRHSLDTEHEPLLDGDAIVMATSGTTGVPKGVVMTHDALRAHANAVHARLDVDPDRDAWLACLPVTHMGGLGVVTRSYFTSTPVTIHYRFDAHRAEQAARDGATLVSLVSTAMRRVDTSLFRTIVLGGSAIPPDRPDNAVATYGLTETGGGVVYDGMPLDGVEMRINDRGEIELRCPMLLRTYHNGPDPFTADGWFPTGDLGAIDDDGVLSVQGRRGDMIISGGENVWPAPIEAVLGAHPAIAGVAVVGRPDPEWGQAVTAVVDLVNGQPVPTLDELRELVKSELPAACAPRAIEVVDELPRTALGKIRRSGL